MNIANMKKEEIVQRFNFRCSHGHNGLAHPSCYEKEKNIEKKVGFLDIETSNLKATFGIVFSYCIKTLNGDILKNVVTPKELKEGIYDKRLMEDFCKDARKYDRLIGYYSSCFDVPFLRSRCVYHKLNFPIYKEIKHTDLYMMIRGRLNMHSKRLGVVCEFFGIPAKEHPMTSHVWFRAMQGQPDALKYILIHNVEDVISTEAVWLRVSDYARVTDTSI